MSISQRYTCAGLQWSAVRTNKQVAVLLRQMGVLLEGQGVAFKPAAYRRAAQVIEDLTQNVSAIVTKAKTRRLAEKALMALPGVGEAIAGKIVEFIETGRIAALDRMLAEQGGLSAELMSVEGLGPKRVRELQSLGIRTTQELMRAAEGGKLRDLPRFGEVMERKLLENAKHVQERTRRFPRSAVQDDVEQLLRTLRAVKGVGKCAAAGSYRRQREDVGDIDVLIVTAKPKDISSAIAKLPMVRTVVAQGEKKLSFDLRSGIRTDIRFVRSDQWGSALLYFTGDKQHNIVLRKRAMERGWKLNEYGLFAGTKVIASHEEKDIYRALGMLYVEPMERTGTFRSRHDA